MQTKLKSFLIVGLYFAVIPADHAADRSRGGEQPADQLWWRSHVPEVPAELLHPQPAVPPWAGGLDPRLQPRPQGEAGATAWATSDLSEHWITWAERCGIPIGLSCTSRRGGDLHTQLGLFWRRKNTDELRMKLQEAEFELKAKSGKMLAKRQIH